MKHYILTVDDEPDVLGTLKRALERENYEVGQARSAHEALHKIAERRPDLLILDITMPPGMDGLELCKQLRADPRYVDLPILFLTAHAQTQEIVAGLDAGGDDYVTKPFVLTELSARVRALLRRSQPISQEQSILQLGKVCLDSSTYRVRVDQNEVQLTATEHRLLRYLMEHPNQAHSAQHLLEVVWDYPANTGDPDLVRAHIRNLRNKLGDKADAERFIRTIHGIGYMVALLY
jgi:DNA-binding response OmpR family regulator